MDQVRYMISDAARLVEVESHVLRYWEEELELPIARNEMGHRYYTEDDIQLLKHIKTLKERGYQLKAIKMDISENGELIPKEETLPQELPRQKQEVLNDNAEKMMQFQNILSKALGQALQENQEGLSRELGGRVADQITKEINYQFRAQEEREEAYFRKLDERLKNVRVKNAKVKKEKVKPEKKRFTIRKREKIQREAAEPT